MTPLQKKRYKERIAVLRECYTVIEAAERIGIAESSFRNWLGNYKVEPKKYLKPRKGNLPEGQYERRIEAIRKSRTWKEAAALLNTSDSPLRQWAHFHKLAHHLGADAPVQMVKPTPVSRALLDQGMTREEACALAAEIRKYWRSQGYHVDAWAVRLHANCGIDPSTDIFEVQSDLINGLPRDWKGRAA